MILALYGTFTAAYVFAFRERIRETNWLLFCAALGSFAVSLLLDVVPVLLFDPSATVEDVPGRVLDAYVFAEDGAKLIGILAWSVYFVQTSRSWLRAATPRS